MKFEEIFIKVFKYYYFNQLKFIKLSRLMNFSGGGATIRRALLLGEIRYVYDHFYPFSNTPWFLCVCSASLLKTLWEKEKLLVTSYFSFSHSAFYLFGELASTFIKSEIVVRKLFTVLKCLKFVL